MILAAWIKSVPWAGNKLRYPVASTCSRYAPRKTRFHTASVGNGHVELNRFSGARRLSRKPSPFTH